MIYLELNLYVCIEVAFRGVPLEKGVQLAQGGALKGDVQCPSPAGTLSPASHSLAHTCAKRFL